MPPMKTFKPLASTLLVLASLVPGMSTAQSTNDWKFEASIYAYLPDISGRVVFPPPVGGQDVSVDVGTILDNLKFAFMGSFEARRGQWGVFTDVVYFDVGNVQDNSQALSLGRLGLPADVSASVSFDLKAYAWSLVGTYAVVADPDFKLDALAGARVIDMRPKVNWALTGNVGQIPAGDRTGAREVKEQNWDLIVGFKGRASFSPDGKWFLPYYLDLGAGESQFTWQAMAGVGYGFGWGDVVASWRYVDYQMKSGSAIEELNFNGPAIAAVFRW